MEMSKKMNKKQLKELKEKSEHFDKTVRPFCFHELKSKFTKNNVINIKKNEVDSFFEKNNYDRIDCSIELFNEIKNKLKLDFRQDPYVPINKCFCIIGEQCDEIVVDDYYPFE